MILRENIHYEWFKDKDMHKIVKGRVLSPLVVMRRGSFLCPNFLRKLSSWGLNALIFVKGLAYSTCYLRTNAKCQTKQHLDSDNKIGVIRRGDWVRDDKNKYVIASGRLLKISGWVHCGLIHLKMWKVLFLNLKQCYKIMSSKNRKIKI